MLKLRPLGSSRVYNSILSGQLALVLIIREDDLPDQSTEIELTQNTIRCDHLLRWMADRNSLARPLRTDDQYVVRADLVARSNLFDVGTLLLLPPPRMVARNAETVGSRPEYLRHYLRWRGETNYFIDPIQLTMVMVRRQWISLPRLTGSLPQWQSYWESDANSLIGQVAYQADGDPTDPESFKVLSWEPPPELHVGYRPGGAK